jgi:hypothetical protein
MFIRCERNMSFATLAQRVRQTTNCKIIESRLQLMQNVT